jgi:hypothetical protein
MRAFANEIADPYAADFIDVAGLNQTASDAIVARLRESREGAACGAAEGRCHSITILGPAGAGKTHLFARVRRQCGQFVTPVLLRPEVGVESSLRHVLGAAVDALRRKPVGDEASMLDVVVGGVLARLLDMTRNFPTAVLADLAGNGDQRWRDAVDVAIETASQRLPEVDLDWLGELLRVPFLRGAARTGALVWLSGREPGEADLRRIGRTAPLPAEASLSALRTLALVAAPSAPLLLVFDQLENLVGDDPSLVHAHARVVADLVDGLRHAVVVQMALDAEWERRIRPQLTPAERARLEAQVFTLALPTPEQLDQLLEAHLVRLPAGERPGPFPAPFSEAGWRAYRAMVAPRPTPRALIVAARRLHAGEVTEDSLIGAPAGPGTASATAGASAAGGGAPVSGGGVAAFAEGKGAERAAFDDFDAIARSLEERWERLLAAARAERDAAAAEGRGIDAERLTGALVVALGARRAGAGRQRWLRLPVDSDASHPNAPNRSRDVLLFVAQGAHHRSLGAVLDQALAAAADSEVAVVRERALPVPPTWRAAREKLASLRATGRAAFVWLGHDDVATLLAEHDLVTAARSRDLSGPDGRPLEERWVDEWRRTRSSETEQYEALKRLIRRVHDGADSTADWGVDEGAPFEAEAASLWRCAHRDVTESESARGTQAGAASSGAPGPALRVLARLRLASIDRVVREAAAESTGKAGRLTRAQVLAELRAAPLVRVLGQSIVYLDERSGSRLDALRQGGSP